VADITYIRLRESFLYLAVILDAYSRRVIGWALGNTLQAELAVEALRSALEQRPVNASLVHHSDRGVQYCARAYVDLLHSHGIQISMSRSGNPYDNALAESFMRTLKCEEVYLNIYRDLDDALLHIQDFLERIYNCERLHSSLGYLSPVAYEALPTTTLWSSGLSFLRHKEDLSVRWTQQGAERFVQLPTDHLPMSLQPAIPSWVALQQSPCPLRRFSTASRFILLLYSPQQPTATVLFFSVSTEGSTPNSSRYPW